MTGRTERNDRHKREVWGVLGGMGPLASAEFIRTIYEQNIGPTEQLSPAVLLLSDPSIPDRTESLRDGETEILLSCLSSGIRQLVSAGATRVIVCCLTIHCLLPFLERDLREKVLSLVDLVFDALLRNRREVLLLCTQGTMLSGVFSAHCSWKDVQHLVVPPSEEDQASIHRLIYDIKMNRLNSAHLLLVNAMMEKYHVSSYIAGCTELHILTRERARMTGSNSNDFCIDPLAIAASMMSWSAKKTCASADSVL